MVRVFDGDGFLTRIAVSDPTLEIETAVRFGFIDAPELGQPRGYEARNFLTGLIGGRWVDLAILVTEGDEALEVAGFLGPLETNMQVHSEPRNLLCHTPLFGTLESHPEMVVLGPVKPLYGADASARAVPFSHIKAAGLFAKRSWKPLTELAEVLQKLRLEEPARDHPPSRRRSSRKRQSAPPRKPRG